MPAWRWRIARIAALGQGTRTPSAGGNRSLDLTARQRERTQTFRATGLDFDPLPPAPASRVVDPIPHPPLRHRPAEPRALPRSPIGVDRLARSHQPLALPRRPLHRRRASSPATCSSLSPPCARAMVRPSAERSAAYQISSLPPRRTLRPGDDLRLPHPLGGRPHLGLLRVTPVPQSDGQQLGRCSSSASSSSGACSFRWARAYSIDSAVNNSPAAQTRRASSACGQRRPPPPDLHRLLVYLRAEGRRHLACRTLRRLLRPQHRTVRHPLGKLFYPYPAVLMKLLTDLHPLSGNHRPLVIVFLPFSPGPSASPSSSAFFGLHAGFGAFPCASASSPGSAPPHGCPSCRPGFWEGLFIAPADPGSPRPEALYFDGDCGFCKRMALVDPDLPPASGNANPLPAQSDPSIHDEDMREHNSWVVVDHAGRRAFKFEAIVTSCRHSPSPPGSRPSLPFPPFARIGARPTNSSLPTATAPGPSSASSSRARFMPRPAAAGRHLIVAFLLAYVISSGTCARLTTERYEISAALLGQRASAMSTALEQRWDMFAPYPLTGRWLVRHPRAASRRP
jgi:hypothetical protein